MKYENTVLIVLIVIVFVSMIFGVSIGTDHNVNQSAVCAVLSKHTQNRDPKIINGECTMLVGGRGCPRQDERGGIWGDDIGGRR